MRKYSTLYTLDLAFAEICSVTWKRVKFFDEDMATSAKALGLARGFIDNTCNVVQSRELLQRAFELAVEEGITAYDALFLCLAQESGLQLLTTDEKLHQKVARSSKLTGLTRLG